MCELCGSHGGFRSLRRAASGFPRSFGRTEDVSFVLCLMQACQPYHLGVLGAWVGVFVIAELCCGVMQRLDLARKVQLGPSSLPPPKVTFATAFHDTSNHRLDFTDPFNSMSRASKITLATTCIGAVGIIAAVHFGQKIEKAVCRCSHHFLVT